jgi:uncharacterized protein involved in exopolysaccharide biosynthesis
MAAKHEAALNSQKAKLEADFRDERQKAMQKLTGDLARKQAEALEKQRKEISKRLADAAQAAFDVYDTRIKELEQGREGLAKMLKEAERARDEAVAKLAPLETEDTKLNGKLFPVPGTGHGSTDGRTSHVGPIDGSVPDGDPASASSTQIRGTG